MKEEKKKEVEVNEQDEKEPVAENAGSSHNTTAIVSEEGMTLLQGVVIGIIVLAALSVLFVVL